MVHQSQERLIRRKKNSRVVTFLMILILLAFGVIYIQVVQTIRMINRDNANSEPRSERVEVGSTSDSVNLYETR